ncbi:PD-(D/E)XK nuclease superfamily protein [Desulfobotulus alkaliphilus]|uniref:PD-(D/E)XK nuclease superfamily protein n=1 Tax=Desulfobotulus alkaliphilus TaxID=622671 RepID=A0A562S2S5_9BACT|nr:AAA family ATPase [Desulfobotulus alkaliphilus]TWI75679.1 PD-(D/E)XK nuclease superfamily protein [Desulfobotulus alkaliphilus]
MARKIPYAVASYEKIVHENYHFVDKTRFIHELERYEVPVFLRPRRFGKSLWCSILECYYDIQRKDQFDTLFGHTEIGLNPTALKNSHLVLRFDFSKVRASDSLEEIEISFKEECLNSFGLFLNQYRAFLPDFIQPESRDASTMLARILQTVRMGHAPPVHIIIDEYDNFTNQLLNTRQDRLYNALTTGDSFLRSFYKVIKAGVGEGSVARVFITGVLPVTMDDLTSGFNIGQVITLKEHVLEMLGFTQGEVEAYVDAIFKEEAFPENLKARVLEDLKTHYNGYRLLPDAENPLYNSTICNFYLNDLVLGKGKIPVETMDDNLRVSVDWLRRLAGGDHPARELLEHLMLEGTLRADLTLLRSRFSMNRFFSPEFLPISLYYLGMVTFKGEFRVGFPNLSTKRIFAEYFNELERIDVSGDYAEIFEAFLEKGDMAELFAGYWRTYVGQIPAQAFDKANENFFRTTFFELCARFLSRHLFIAIEVNRPSGRSDFEAIGRPGSRFEGKAHVLEFKHLSRQKAAEMNLEKMEGPGAEEVEQVGRYARDLKAQWPELTVCSHVVYTVAGAGFRFFSL